MSISKDGNESFIRSILHAGRMMENEIDSNPQLKAESKLIVASAMKRTVHKAEIPTENPKTQEILRKFAAGLKEKMTRSMAKNNELSQKLAHGLHQKGHELTPKQAMEALTDIPGLITDMATDRQINFFSNGDEILITDALRHSRNNRGLCHSIVTIAVQKCLSEWDKSRIPFSENLLQQLGSRDSAMESYASYLVREILHGRPEDSEDGEES